MNIAALICLPLLSGIQRDLVPISALAALLDSKITVQGRDAAYELGLRGEQAEAVIPKLLQLLRTDADEDVRIAACYGLARAGKKDRLVREALVLAMQNDSLPVRGSAAGALGDMGAAAKDVTPALIKALKDPDQGVRINASGALSAIGPNEAALAALEEALKDKSATVRVAVAIILLGKAPTKKAYRTLTHAIKTKDDLQDDDQRQAQAFAFDFLMNRIDENRASMVPALIDALVDKEPYVRQCAAHSLGQVGAPAKSAIAWLKRALKDDHAPVRKNAEQAIGKIEAALTKTRR